MWPSVCFAKLVSAVPFITSGGEGDGDAAEGGDTTLRVNEEALEVLRKISGPISVVSVVGLYRTGKSFLVNRIVGAIFIRMKFRP